MKILNLSFILLVLNQSNVPSLASDRRFAHNKFPIECVGHGVLDSEPGKSKRPNKVYSQLECLVHEANKQRLQGKYLQAKSNFAKAIASFEQAQRKDPKGFAPHLADQADCIEGYASVLRHLKRDAGFWEKKAQAIRQNLAHKKPETRNYSNGYSPYQP